MFILDRLFPTMLRAHRASFRRQIDVEIRAGRWHGFERPPADEVSNWRDR